MAQPSSKARPCPDNDLFVDSLGAWKHPEIGGQADIGPLPSFDESDVNCNSQSRPVAPSACRVGSQRRLYLPIVINGEIIQSRPDSSCENNIIAAEVVSSLDLVTNTAPEHRKTFRLANGSLMEALGQVVFGCSFALEQALQLTCVFYVFKRLICPILIGMSFLNETETLSKYRHRL